MIEIPAGALLWITSRDVGTSSRTIFKVLSGAVFGKREMSMDEGIPHDRDDFGRCYRLIEAAPEWQGRLKEVSAVYPAWKPIIDNWAVLCEKYEKESPDFFPFIQSLHPESRRLDGWTQTGPSSWIKGEG